MRNPTQVWAIVPAAGMSRRFRGSDAVSPQQPKQLASFGDRSMLATVLDALEASRVAGVVAVVNPAVADRIRQERPPTSRRRYAVNDRRESEMIESIQMGFPVIAAWIAARGVVSGPTGYLICPGDCPRLTPANVDACVAAFEEDPLTLVIASHQGRRGHPIILPDDLAGRVLHWTPARRLSEVRELYPERVRLVETGPGVLVDVDTPADLERASHLEEADS